MITELAHQLEIISNLGGNPIVMSSIILITLVFLHRQKQHKTALIVMLTSISLFYSNFLKNLFKHSRPLHSPAQYYLWFDIYSFPSSHVLYYTTFWGFIIYLTYKYTQEAKLFLHVIRWFSAYMIISIGASRIFLGVHYVKDVVAGYFFGLIFLFSLIWLDKMLEKTRIKNK